MTDLREELARALANLSTLNPEEMVKGASGQFEPRWRAHLPAADLFFVPIIERRIAAARAEGRERCAMTAQELRHPHGYSSETPDWVHGTVDAAAAIRALGDK